MVFASLMVYGPDLLAQKYRYPLPPTVGEFGYYFDRTLTASGMSDWGCTNNTYGGHAGTDFLAPSGTPVYAAAVGTVVKAFEADVSFGVRVMIRHPNGLYTLYGHLKHGSLRVAVGQTVSCGQHIADVGSTGNVEQGTAHLHFGVYRSPTEDALPADAVDPFKLAATPYDCTGKTWCQNRPCVTSPSVSLWVEQGEYGGGSKNRRPSAQCDTSYQEPPKLDAGGQNPGDDLGSTKVDARRPRRRDGGISAPDARSDFGQCCPDDPPQDNPGNGTSTTQGASCAVGSFRPDFVSSVWALLYAVVLFIWRRLTSR